MLVLPPLPLSAFNHFRVPSPILTCIAGPVPLPGAAVPSAALRAVTLSGCRMWALVWLSITSLCLGTAWAVPAKGERRKVEKLKADLAPYESLDLDSYDLTLDNYGEILDLSNYEDLYDYGDLAPKVRRMKEGTQQVGQVFPWVSRGLLQGVDVALQEKQPAEEALLDFKLCQHLCPLPAPGQSSSAGSQDLRLPASLWASREGSSASLS